MQMKAAHEKAQEAIYRQRLVVFLLKNLYHLKLVIFDLLEINWVGIITSIPA